MEKRLRFSLIRSRRKTLAMQLSREGELVVRAPLRLALAEIERFVAAHEAWAQKQLRLRQERLEKRPEPTQAEIEALKRQARELLPPRVAFFSAQMGLFPSAIRINAARARFGSCSAKNSLNFSCFLLRYPQAAIDYVVVHELAHIAHKNHGREFYALIASILPDYQARRALLRE
ncbi:MAG: M48 family metallopeptidase [Christensenellaceae bacterium]|jgi:predicted metal-dependent hydrolase|nr:M48 family metallopeptidase [Christensenellaceae bacterium]